jgi:cell division protein FtsN
MNRPAAYHLPQRNMRMHVASLVMVLCLLLLSAPSHAQDEPLYDEIPVFLEVPGVGGFEMQALIRDEELYIPVKDLFDLLKIRNVPSPEGEKITGFFLEPEAEYSISRPDNLVTYMGKDFRLEDGDIIRTDYGLYLHSPEMGRIFGLECIFSFRSMSVKLKSKSDLPVIRELRQDEMRKNLARLKGEMIADTSVKRTYPLFRFGMADWSVLGNQEINGRKDARLNLSLGAMIAGGEATASLNYNTYDKFSEKQQYYLWRYADNDMTLFKQAMIGKINTQSTSTIFNPVVGVQVTNTPTTYRRSFGTYTLSDMTEPGWMVELYVNNVLVDYVKADASGFFRFSIPLVYGNSHIQLKFYGPWGEERVREQNINIPFNFLPAKTFEYRISAGFVEDSTFSRFSRLSTSYGVSRTLTVGAGFEYLSSVSSGPLMPYVNASWSVFNNLLLSGEYTNGVRSRGTLSYRLPSNTQFDLQYTWYDRGQKAILYNYLEERRAVIASPLKIHNFSTYNRLSVYQILFPSIRYHNGEAIPSVAKYTTGEWMLSGTIGAVNTNLTTYSIFIGETKPYLYSNLSFSFRLPGEFVIMPQSQFAYTGGKFLSARISAEKRIKERAFLNLALEQNFLNNIKMAELGFRYNFRFAQAGTSVRQTGSHTSFVEYARGSLIVDGKTNYVGGSNQFNVGKGGISVIPFIDLNGNGIRDKNEPKAPGLNLRSSGGIVGKSDRDTTIRIIGLEPYTRCFIDLDANSFENISWRLPYKIIDVTVDPEIMKHVEIPVTVAGEASGRVTTGKEGDITGIARIIINFSDKSGKHISSTLSESDGYFSWFGFSPGGYTASVDTNQLRKLGMASEPSSRDFTVKPGIEGEYITDLDFRLLRVSTDTVQPVVVKPLEQTRKDTTFLIVHEEIRELVTITSDSWAIQMGAFKNRSFAEGLRKKLEAIVGRSIEIVIEDDFYKLRISEIPDRMEVDSLISILHKGGVDQVWVLRLIAKQQQVIFREVSDSVLQIHQSKIFVPFGEEFYKLRTGGQPLIEPTVVNVIKSNTREARLSKGRPRELVRLEADVPVKPREIITVTPVLVTVPRIAPMAGNSIIEESRTKSLNIPYISLQVGIFYKKAEAERARKRIMSKLNLPVEIVQQWEYFRVIITGFHSREETYQYYPELAGLGYPNISMIEE